MPQYDFGTINTATTTGGDLATLLQNWRDAVLSNHSGTTRPSYVKTGQIWVNTSVSGAWVVNLYDGAVDIPLGYVNTTDDAAGFLSYALVTTKTASATIALTERDMMVGVAASTANLTMTLPAAATAKNGFRIRFQKTDNTAFTITVTRSGSDLINGGTGYVLTQQYDTVELIADGATTWYAYGGVLDLSINSNKLADNSVTTNKIAANAVTAAKLANGAIGTTQLADNSVTAAKIVDGTVGSAELATSAVTSVKIADSAVGPTKLSGGQSGTAPIYCARAWVNFNGSGTPAVVGGGNVSSITDNGIGDYTVNMTTAQADTNYSVVAMASHSALQAYIDCRGDTTTLTTGSFRLNVHIQSSSVPTKFDPTTVYAMVMR